MNILLATRPLRSRELPGSMVAGCRPAGDRRRIVSLERLALEPFSGKSQTKLGLCPPSSWFL